MAYLENVERFRGTGEKNQKGMDLEDFLAAYDPKKYDCPSNTVDMLIFRSEEPYRYARQPLKLLMIKRGNHPSIGCWALPGGFVDLRENLEDAAKRELEEETGLKDLPLVQLRTWGDYDRDPRWRVITTAYLSLVEGELPVKAGDDAADALWMDVSLREGQGSESVREYVLCFSNKEYGIELGAQVRCTVKQKGLLANRHYELLASDGVAADHSLIIADALLFLRDRIKEVAS